MGQPCPCLYPSKHRLRGGAPQRWSLFGHPDVDGGYLMLDPWHHIRASDPFSQRPARSQKERTESGKSKRKKPLVLVVDDEHLIADTMTEILNRCGFQAVCAYNGSSALELAIEVTPDFVVTDVVMPNMNGVQLAIAIRKF